MLPVCRGLEHKGVSASSQRVDPVTKSSRHGKSSLSGLAAADRVAKLAVRALFPFERKSQSRLFCGLNAIRFTDFIHFHENDASGNF